MDTWLYQDTIRTRLQNEGVFFTRAYHATSLCMPSRASIETGQYPWNHGVIDGNHVSPVHFNLGTNANECLWEYTLGRMLHDARSVACPDGYNTAFFGKWCNGSWYSNMPAQTGPTTKPPGWDQWIMSDPSLNEPDGFTYLLYENGQVYNFGNTEQTNASLPNVTDYKFQTIKPGFGIGARLPSSDGTYDTDYKQDVYRIKAGKVLDDFIEDRVGHSKPFFMQVSFNSPHQGTGNAWRYTNNHSTKALQIKNATLPQSANFHVLGTGPCDDQIAASTAGGSPPNDQSSTRKGQMGKVAPIDDFLDMAFHKLDVAGLTDKTIVIYLGDNGLASGENWIVGGKQDRFEPSSLTPLFIRGPEFGRGTSPHFAQGTSSQLTATIDLVPTIVGVLNAAGAGITPRLAGGVTTFDGQSLLDLTATRVIGLYDTQGGPGTGTIGSGFKGVVTKDEKYIETVAGGSGGQFQLFRWGDNLDTYASTPTEVINGVTVNAMSFPIEQETANLVNPNTGALVAGESGLSSTLTTLQARLGSIVTTNTFVGCQGSACHLTVP